MLAFFLGQQMRVQMFYAPLSTFIEEIGIIGLCCLHQNQKILIPCVLYMLSTEQLLPGNTFLLAFKACVPTKESRLLSLQPLSSVSSYYLRRFHAELTYFPRTVVVIASLPQPRQISQGFPYTKQLYVLRVKYIFSAFYLFDFLFLRNEMDFTKMAMPVLFALHWRSFARQSRITRFPIVPAFPRIAL